MPIKDDRNFFVSTSANILFDDLPCLPNIEDWRGVIDGAVDLRVKNGCVAIVLGGICYTCIPHHSVEKVARQSHS